MSETELFSPEAAFPDTPTLRTSYYNRIVGVMEELARVRPHPGQLVDRYSEPTRQERELIHRL